jgi:hypothetical protein
MRRSTLLVCLAVFAAVFAVHFGYHAWQEARVASQWVALESVGRPSAWDRYVERKDFYLGYSYALAAAFTAFAVLFTIEQRRRQVGSVLGGLGLMGGLYIAGCFLIGCCGSPMLVVYLSVFGTSILGLLKPIVAAVTTLSVLLSGIYVVRRSRRLCCPIPADNKPDPKASSPQATK